MIDLDYIYDNLEELIKESQEQDQLSISYPLDIEITSAEGSYLVDKKNNKYLDMTSNKGLQPIGFGDMAQESTLIADSGLFKTSVYNSLENELKVLTSLDKVYFTESEKESFDNLSNFITAISDQDEKSKVLISSINNNKYGISCKNIDYIPINYKSILKSVFTKSVIAVVIELVQVSENIDIANYEYLKELKSMCLENNACLILDLTNVSPLRTGNNLLNYDKDIKPDGIIISSNFANGIPFGAIVLSAKMPDIKVSNKSAMLTLAGKQINTFINIKSRNKLIENIERASKHIQQKLISLQNERVSIGDIDITGMLFTFAVEFNAYQMVQKAFDKGLIIEALSQNRIKLEPNYNISVAEIDKAFEIIEAVIDDLAKFDKV